MNATRVLTKGQSIVNGDTALVMRTDGNLVVTRGGVVRWSAGTTGSGNTTVFQADGNLVTYTSSQATAWSSRTDGHNGAVLVFQTNGNIQILYQGGVLWQSGTGS